MNHYGRAALQKSRPTALGVGGFELVIVTANWPLSSSISGLLLPSILFFFIMHDKDPQVAVMASAELCKDLEPGLPSGRVIDEKGQLQLYQHIRGSSQSVSSSRRSSYEWTRDKMPSFRRLTIMLLIVAFLTVTYASVPVYKKPQRSPDRVKETSFEDLLNSVSDASLHDVLLKVYEKYRHGVFPEVRTAMQAVHDDNAAVATCLVELARRQNPNVTASVTVSAPSTPTVVVVPTTETDTVVQTSGSDTVVVVNTQTTVTPMTQDQPTTPAGNTVQTTGPQVSSNPPSEPSSSVPVPIQSTVPVQSVNSSPLPGFSSPAPVSPSPSSQANPTSQANPSSQAPAQSPTNGGGGGTASGEATTSPGSAFPTTLAKTSSQAFTSTSPGQAGASSSGGAGAATAKSSSTQQVVYTTTFPNGSQSTVTSYTIVPAGDQASTPGVAGSGVTETPSLQNGAVDGTQPRGMGLVGSLAAALIFVVGIL